MEGGEGGPGRWAGGMNSRVVEKKPLKRPLLFPAVGGREKVETRDPRKSTKQVCITGKSREEE